MNTLKTIYQHWPTVSLALGAAVSGGIHAYQIIVKAGGIKNIWANFWNGESKPQPPAPTDSAQPKQP